MLEEIGLQGGRPCFSSYSEPVQNVMELYGFRHKLINDDVNDLPEYPHQSNSTVLASNLGDNNSSGPISIHHQLHFRKHHLYDLQNNLPPGRVVFSLYPGHQNPAIQVLHLHPQCPPPPKYLDERASRPIKFPPWKVPIHQVDRLYHYGYGFPPRGGGTFR